MKNTLTLIMLGLLLTGCNTVITNTPTNTDSVTTTEKTTLPSNNNTTSTKEKPPENIINDGVLDVATVNDNKEFYSGKKITLNGVIKHQIGYSLMSCPEEINPCNPITGVWLELQDVNKSSAITIYKRDGDTYVKQSCAVTNFYMGTYDCGMYQDGAVVKLTGVFLKHSIPIAWVNSAPIKFQDIYIFVSSNLAP